jgi:hypothetical protein
MKFSLKSLLIAMCVVGAVFGVMARLFIENPEMFLAVLRVGCTIGPFLLAVATIIWVGLRGSPPRRWLIAWGCVLALTPVAMMLVISVLMPSGNPLQMMSTRRLIATRLPAQMDQPWVWRELERRLAEGDLTKEQADQAVRDLAAFMKRSKPAGYDSPLSWQRDFLTKARMAGFISDKTLLELVEAFYGSSPTVQLQYPAIDENVPVVEFNIKFGNPWGENSGHDVAMLWKVKRVLVDDLPQPITRYSPSGHHAYLAIDNKFKPGDHILTVEIECAFVDLSKLAGLDADSLPVDQWPKARKRWTTKQNVALRVEALNAAEE